VATRMTVSDGQQTGGAYDSLTAKQLIARVPNISTDTLRRARRYEARHKARVTVLTAMDAELDARGDGSEQDDDAPERTPVPAVASPASVTADLGPSTPGRFNVWEPPGDGKSDEVGEPWRAPASSSWETQCNPAKPAFFKRKGFYIPTAIVAALIALATAAGSSSTKSSHLNEARVTTPVTTPPVTAPPVTAPPVTAPPDTAPPVTTPPVTKGPFDGETVTQRNARQKAADYLGYTSFSRSGLIKQLMFEGFSEADAAYGTDAQHANWNQQAAKKAADYLGYTSFSRESLIHQLEFDGFTPAEAAYGVSTTGL